MLSAAALRPGAAQPAASQRPPRPARPSAQARRLACPSVAHKAAASTGATREAATGRRAAPTAPPPRSTAPARRCVAAAAAPEGNDGSSPADRLQDNQIFLGVGLGLTLLVLAGLRLGGYLEGADDGLAGGSAFGPGDAVAAALWTASLYFCSPLQLLIIFFGSFERERPSDWVLRQLGRLAGLQVDAINYKAPAALQAATVGLFAASGLSVAYVLEAGLGDATWGVSTGLGACMGAAMYEAGRPRRLSVEEAQQKEEVWQDFVRFASARLQRSGRCHESEILRALGRELPRYRSLDSNTMRQLVRNWAPDADRSSQGFYKGVSLVPGGGAAMQPAAAASPSAEASTDADAAARL